MAGGVYGSATDPNDYGSGGGAGWDTNTSGGHGGGLLRITASATLSVNGTITADGQAGTWWGGGGGSGGGIRLQAATLSGTGVIRARGGTPSDCSDGGGGGGGRIAIYAEQLFAGTIAYSGAPSGGANDAGQGSFHTAVSTADRICDSGTLATTCTVSSVKWIGQNLATGISGANLTLAAGGELRHSERKDWVSLTLTGMLDVSGVLRANLKRIEAGTVRVRSGGSIVGNVGGPDAVNFPGITHTTTVTIEAGGLINADGAGYEGGDSNTKLVATGRYRRISSGGGAGGGTWGNDTGGGGGHGGTGGNGGGAGAAGGVTYGSSTDPSDYGSGGARGHGNHFDGGDGGGLIRINASGVVTLNGTLSTDGVSAGWISGGGGAGGGIRVHGGTLVGAGTLRARGGTTDIYGSGGGGGGGRIALTRGGGAAFGGTLQVTGGAGQGTGLAGAAGTTYQP